MHNVKAFLQHCGYLKVDNPFMINVLSVITLIVLSIWHDWPETSCAVCYIRFQMCFVMRHYNAWSTRECLCLFGCSVSYCAHLCADKSSRQLFCRLFIFFLYVHFLCRPPGKSFWYYVRRLEADPDTHWLKVSFSISLQVTWTAADCPSIPSTSSRSASSLHWGCGYQLHRDLLWWCGAADTAQLFDCWGWVTYMCLLLIFISVRYPPYWWFW